MKRSILFLMLFSIWLHSCDTDDSECGEIYYSYVTDADSIFKGRWQWVYTKVYCWDNSPAVIGQWHVSDSIYPGDVRPWLPNGYPDRWVEMGEDVTISTDGEQRTYCITFWQSLKTTSSSLHGPAGPGVTMHLRYIGEGLQEISFLQYDVLAQDTIEFSPDMQRDTSCLDRVYATIDFYARVY